MCALELDDYVHRGIELQGGVGRVGKGARAHALGQRQHSVPHFHKAIIVKSKVLELCDPGTSRAAKLAKDAAGLVMKCRLRTRSRVEPSHLRVVLHFED